MFACSRSCIHRKAARKPTADGILHSEIPTIIAWDISLHDVMFIGILGEIPVSPIDDYSDDL